MQCKQCMVYVRDRPRAIALCPTRPPLSSRVPGAATAGTQVLVIALRDTTNRGRHAPAPGGDPRSAIGCDLHLADVSVLRDFSVLDTDPVYGCVGVIYHERDVYLALVTECDFVCQVLPREAAYSLRRVSFLSLTSAKYDDWQRYDPNPTEYDDPAVGSSSGGGYGPHPCQALSQYLAQASFFFSPNMDMTRNLQARYTDCISSERAVPYDVKYLWNHFLLKPFLRFRASLDRAQQQYLDDAAFLVPLIQGYVGSVPLPHASATGPNQLCIVSRSSSGRAGARYLTRGLDDMGNVANEVETEVICLLGTRCYSTVILRGSIPLFWEQSGLQISDHKIQLTRSAEATEPAFRLHVQALLQRYRRVHVVDLLKGRDGGSEYTLSHAFHSQIRHLQLPDLVRYTHFDFHAMCKGSNFANVELLVDRVADSVKAFGFFLIDLKELRILRQQGGVFRVNCMDCLDRTNFSQNALSWATLAGYLRVALDQPASVMSHIRQEHAQLWVANGDRISRLYAGTGALRSNVLKSGKSTWTGLLQDVTKSVSRFYQNNFQDQSKQHVMDVLLGKTPEARKIHAYLATYDVVRRHLTAQADRFLRRQSLTFFVTTFNVCSNLPRLSDVEKWLATGRGHAQPDAYVIGLQEVVDLNVSQVVSGDSTKRFQWERLIIRALDRIAATREEGTRASGDDDDESDAPEPVHYVVLTSEQLIGACLMVFIRRSLAPHVRGVETTLKKTGFGGLAGNKGAVALRMQIYDTQFCFVTSHFAAGPTNYEERNADYRSIRDGVTFSNGRAVEDHQYVFWFGDLNYRLNLSYDQAKSLLAQDRLQEMRRYDQLIAQKAMGNIFHNYYEAPITFPPTYKFDVGTARYDTSEKRRTPSWTDRILIRSAGYDPDTADLTDDVHDGLQEDAGEDDEEDEAGGAGRGLKFDILRYISYPLTTSDHMPVLAIVRTEVVEVNRSVRRQLIQDISKELAVATRPGDGKVGSPPTASDSRRAYLSPPSLPPTAKLIDVEPSPSTSGETPKATTKLYHKKPPPPPPTSAQHKTKKPATTTTSVILRLPPPSSATTQWWNEKRTGNNGDGDITPPSDPLSSNPFRDSALSLEKATREAALGRTGEGVGSNGETTKVAAVELPDYLDDIFESHTDEQLDGWEPIKPSVEI
ncbi:Inositol-1,4,5-trisphosphate 5-phosphatase 1 [Tieghemiomyces parasiticus]|uniref:phosphoinositide 5-phosphatase n=1 Tax=Tieghemiomyces parasiticus TaxID=78921 RepID=A0A9W7ZLC5_9FUNG|nr:Inositol-1,4,5-trisphosphate 5-phosphatase 1 [Tieghemiomyces parasiticus]